ncbi:MAG: ComEC/Rec2 family competence protein [bacterium]
MGLTSIASQSTNHAIFSNNIRRLNIAAWLKEDLGTGFLWLPVWLGTGIGLYFSFQTEPLLYILLGPTIILIFVRSALMWLPLGHNYKYLSFYQKYHYLLLALILIFAGASIAKMRTQSVNAPILLDKTPTLTITGRIVAITELPQGVRYVLSVVAIDDYDKTTLPKKIRISWHGNQSYTYKLPSINDQIQIRGVLLPPPEPIAPGAFDFGRQLYFEQIGAVGYAITPPYVVQPAHGMSLQKLRYSIKQRILSRLPPSRQEEGNVTAALVTGLRDGINTDYEEALRESGLAHLLAISGLHMGLIMGSLFFISRFVFAHIEYWALHYPIKKWAASVALIGGVFYLLISGASWSAQRAFIMASLFFVAIILDRRALSLRNVAIAALIILILRPEALLHIGFQMSFAAVTALIAVWEWIENKGIAQGWTVATGQDGRLKRILIGFSGLGLTSFIAGLATAPFAMFHFHRVALYGVIGNLLAMPIVTLIIMPMVIVGFFLFPFNLDWIAWRIMTEAIYVVLQIADHVSHLTGAVYYRPALPRNYIVFITIAGLIGLLLKSPIRVIGFVMICVVMLMSAHPDKPVIIIGPEVKNIVVSLPTKDKNILGFQTLTAEKFIAENWITLLGYEKGQVDQKSLQNITPDPYRKCSKKGCEFELMASVRISYITAADTMANLHRHCADNEIIIARFSLPNSVRENCQAFIIDPDYTAQNGTVSIWADHHSHSYIIKTSRQYRGQRPWVLYDR